MNASQTVSCTRISGASRGKISWARRGALPVLFENRATVVYVAFAYALVIQLGSRMAEKRGSGPRPAPKWAAKGGTTNTFSWHFRKNQVELRVRRNLRRCQKNERTAKGATIVVCTGAIGQEED
jgi:hypothetical protein